MDCRETGMRSNAGVAGQNRHTVRIPNADFWRRSLHGADQRHFIADQKISGVGGQNAFCVYSGADRADGRRILYFFIYPQLYGKNEKANSFLCVSRRGRRPEIRPLSPVGDAHGHERADSERSGQRPSVSGNADGFFGCAVYRTSGGKSTRNFAGVAGEKAHQEKIRRRAQQEMPEE